MKKVFNVLGIAVLFIAGIFPAQAQLRWSGWTTVSLTSNQVGAAFGTTNKIRLDCPRSEYLMLDIKYQLTSAETGTSIWHFSPGGESEMMTNAAASLANVGQWQITITPNGTTPVRYFTNLAVGGYPYIYLYRITNNSSEVMTNIQVRYGSKNLN